MENLINTFFKSISRYEFINNLIPGIVLCFVLKYIGYNVIDGDILTNIITCYIAGLINGRVSSLLVEWVCRKTSLIEWRDYDLYRKAKEVRPFIATMQEVANMYRSMASVFLISLFAIVYKLIYTKFIWLQQNGYWIIIIILCGLFLFSYIKQVNDYVVKNIDDVTKDI